MKSITGYFYNIDIDPMDVRVFSGEKLKPLIIGKSAKPRCFSRVSIENLPVMYRNNNSAWMNSLIFDEWTKKLNRDMKRQGRHILLFLDNASCHPKAITLSNVKFQFFPANTTSVNQPMDAGIIQAVKLKFKIRQMKYVLRLMERFTGDQSEMLKRINLLDAIYWVNASWEEVEASTIEKCFAKCGFGSGSDSDSEQAQEEVPLSLVAMSLQLFGVDFHELPLLDANVATCAPMKDWDNPQQIVQEMANSLIVHQEEEEEEEELDSVAPVTVSQVHDCISKLRDFATQNGQSTMLDAVMNLSDMVTEIKFQTCRKQTSITDFFKSN